MQRLTGRFGENDFSDAYAAGMMNINTSKYEKDFLALIGIPRKILCDPVPSTTVIGAVTPQAPGFLKRQRSFLAAAMA